MEIEKVVEVDIITQSEIVELKLSGMSILMSGARRKEIQ